MLKNKKVIKYMIAAAITLTVLSYFSYRTYIQHEFASELIRFHVIANSDSYADQSLKLHIRDVIVNEMKSRFGSANSRDEAEKIVLASMDDIKNLAAAEIAREGKNYNVKVMLGDFDFPTKTYGDLTLPAGNYHAVRVVIGEGKGKNWWCVLFPPLCFVDSVDTLKKSEQARGIKVFEKGNVEFRLKSADIFKIFS